MRRWLAVVAATALGFIAAPAAAETVRWTGHTRDQLWGTAGNWQPARVPGRGDDVVIEDAEGRNATVVMTVDGTVKSIKLGGSKDEVSARLRVLQPLTVYDGVEVSTAGTLEVNAGAAVMNCADVHIDGRFEFAAGMVLGSYTVYGSADLSIDAQKVLRNAHIRLMNKTPVPAAGTFVMTGNSAILAPDSELLAHRHLEMKAMDETDVAITTKGFKWKGTGWKSKRH